MSKDREKAAESQRKPSATTKASVENRAAIFETQVNLKSTHRRGPGAPRGHRKAAILAAAKQEFNEHGYEKATMRGISKAVGCDPALISYYFGSKQVLFRAAMNIPEDPASQILAVFKLGWDGAAERVLKFVLNMYETQITAETMHTLLRTLVTDAATERQFRNYIKDSIMKHLLAAVGGGDELIAEIETAMSIIIGMAMVRYIARLDPLDSMSHAQIVSQFAPILQPIFDRIANIIGPSALPQNE